MSLTAKQSSDFQEDPPRMDEARDADTLLLNIDGYEGPIDVLLDLARSQKVDLAHISILQLARQYLAFIERAKAHNLDLAAEYLVMAAWLAYLKSRLLLPKQEDDEDPHTAEDMAEALQFQLRRLEAMQTAAGALMALPRLGQKRHVRGAPEAFAAERYASWQVNLVDILRAYGAIKARQVKPGYDLPRYELLSLDQAFSRLERMLGALPRGDHGTAWTTLESFLPERVENLLYARSSMASTLTAMLEMAKQGKIEVKQDGLCRPIYLRGVHG